MWQNVKCGEEKEKVNTKLKIKGRFSHIQIVKNHKTVKGAFL